MARSAVRKGKHLTRYVAGVQQVVTRVTPQDQKQVIWGSPGGRESHPLPSEDEEQRVRTCCKFFLV